MLPGILFKGFFHFAKLITGHKGLENKEDSPVIYFGCKIFFFDNFDYA